MIEKPVKHGLPVSRAASERKLRRIDRYDRRAEVTAFTPLTETGTVHISFRVVDDQPFQFDPGQFVGIQANVRGYGYRRTPYCIVSPPNDERTFDLLVRLVPEGPLSYYLGALAVGDVIHFRGPTGRSMIPKETDTELVLLATGVGIGPFMALTKHLLPRGFSRPIRLYWGLRLWEDVCLIDDLHDLAVRHDNFSYEISLSRPPRGWGGLRGRLTSTVPPLLETLGGKQFYLVGNGAMIEEFAACLSDLGVRKQLVYEEHYFNFRHKPTPETVAQIRSGFVARDLPSPVAYMESMELDFPQRGGTL